MVLMGGPSAEHEISLHTGEQIIAHLNPLRYSVTPVTITKTGKWLMPDEKNNRTVDALSKIAKTAHIAFIALHGTFGEDGTVQGLLESFNIPYTGSGICASALGMDKPRSLALFRDSGFYVPKFRVIRKNEFNTNKTRSFLRDISREFSFPLVVKPSNLGSSIGVVIIRSKKDLLKGIQRVFGYALEIIIQKFIPGREITCAILENKNGSLVALPPIEIVPRKNAFYDYESKYSDHGSDHFIPPRNMDKKKITMIQDAARRAHQIIGCSGISRTDFILSNDEKLAILEINTIPGMTPTSLVPQAAQVMGIEFPELLDCIIESALKGRSH